MTNRWLMMIAMVLFAAAIQAQQDVGFADSNEQRSYALGMAIGDKLRSEMTEVDADLYVQGFRDAVSGNETRLSNEEMMTAIKALQRDLTSRRMAVQSTASASLSSLTDIRISFKLDPRLTRGMYMGDRWVSPATFTYANPPQDADGAFAIEVKARGRDARGREMKITPEWTPQNTELLQVTPGQGDHVRFIVKQTGQSRVTVSYAGISKELIVEALQRDSRTQLNISQ